MSFFPSSGQRRPLGCEVSRMVVRTKTCGRRRSNVVLKVGGISCSEILTLLLVVMLPGSLSAVEEDGPALPATRFYDPAIVQTVHLDVSAENLSRLHEALPKRIYVPATFRWNGTTVTNVAVRYKGNSSSSPRQKFKRSFLIQFDRYEESQRFLGLQRVSLDNGIQFGSLFSERLLTDILRELDLPVHRCNHARLFLNGRYHGVYVNVERIDDVFLRARFGNAEGALYKADEGGPGSDFSAIPPEVIQRHGTGFEPKTDAADKHAADVMEFIRAIHQTPPQDFAEELSRRMDVESFLQVMPVMLFGGAFDQLTGWNPHNYYLYRSPRDQRWHYLPWDLDVGFSDRAFGRIPVIDGWHAAWPVPHGPPRPLLEHIVRNEQLLHRYRTRADVILEKHFHPDVLIPKLNAMYSEIEDDLEKDPFPHRRVTNPADVDWNSILESQRAFIRRRYQLARRQLDAPGARPKPVTHREPEPGPTSNNAPTELRLTAEPSERPVLVWKDNADGEAGHMLQRAEGTEGRFRNYLGKPGRNETRATDTMAEKGKTYRYRVFAVFHTPEGPRGSGVSNVITVTIPD